MTSAHIFIPLTVGSELVAQRPLFSQPCDRGTITSVGICHCVKKEVGTEVWLSVSVCPAAAGPLAPTLQRRRE